MIGKVIGAIAGERVARHIRGIDGPGGALIGVVAPMVLRRLGPVGFVAAAAGSYALKRYYDKNQAPANNR